MTDAQLAELVRRYQQQLHRISMSTGAALATAWEQLGQWDEADVERFTEQTTPTVSIAQSHAAAMAAAFVGLAAGLPTGALPGPLSAPAWDAPFTAYWASLANGTVWQEALQVGRNVAEALGFDSVQNAAREATAHIDRSHPAITGWQRIPDPGACDWCLQVAEQTYHSAESASFGHDRCGCSVVPA